MKPGWVAGSVRAQLLARRGLGRSGARAVAAAGSVAAAVAAVAASSYGHDVGPHMGLLDARRGVHAAALWHLRVLAGWLPPGGSERVRVVAGRFEIANVEGHIDEMAGSPPTRPFEMGALATAWPRVAVSRSVAETRAAVASSAWGDPGTDERASLAAALQVAWARRLTERAPELRGWATAYAAVVAAGERFGHGRELSTNAAVDARRLLGPGCDAQSLAAFTRDIATDGRWAFSDVADGDSLWRAEVTVWRRARDEVTRRAAGTKGEGLVAWASLFLVADAELVSGALEAAAWGPAGLEAFDAIA